LLPDLSGLRLDTLLHELIDRAGEIAATQARLRALLKAVVSISATLDIPSITRRIVTTARELADASYGALAIPGPDRTFESFVTVGVDDESIKRIGREPRGEGVLGALMRARAPMRMSDLTTHPESIGFPPGHPPMRSFLGVPVRLRGEPYGYLYLAEKRGGADFTEDDEVVVSALAAAAGAAIENARLFEQTRRREMWLEASTEIASALLSNLPHDTVFDLITQRSRAVAGADMSSIVLPTADPDKLTIAYVDGLNSDVLRGAVLPVTHSLSGVVMRTGVAELVADANADPRAWLSARRLVELPAQPYGPMLFLPLSGGTGPLGVLTMAKRAGSGPFSPVDVRLASNFANHAALVVEFTRAEDDRQRLAVLEDRESIARDLHDLVIQRLFAIGLGLQGTGRMVLNAEVGTRLDRFVQDLDETIREIRGTIFRLQDTGEDRPGLRAQLLDLCGDAVETLGFEPHVRLSGPLDSVVGDPLRQDLLASLREILSNVVRHAHAKTLEIVVEIDTRLGVLLLEANDDGVGITEGGHRGGLANLADRAERHGGELTVTSTPGTGTIVSWRVPLPGAVASGG
jgi:signal transduction histidine kinase